MCWSASYRCFISHSLLPLSYPEALFILQFGTSALIGPLVKESERVSEDLEKVRKREESNRERRGASELSGQADTLRNRV